MTRCAPGLRASRRSGARRFTPPADLELDKPDLVRQEKAVYESATTVCRQTSPCSVSK